VTIINILVELWVVTRELCTCQNIQPVADLTKRSVVSERGVEKLLDATCIQLYTYKFDAEFFMLSL